MSPGDDDRREIARQLFSRQARPLPTAGSFDTVRRTELETDLRARTGRRGPVLVCAGNRVDGLCLAGTVAAQLSAWDRGPWHPGTLPDSAEAARATRAGDVLAMPAADGPWLRRAALDSRAAIVWSADGETGAAAELRLAVTLAGEAGVAGPIVVTAARALPDPLVAWLAGRDGAAGPIRWGGIWRPGRGLPAPLAATLESLMSQKRDA